MYSVLTYDVMKSYLTLCEISKFVRAILLWKQGSLCNKIELQRVCVMIYYLSEREDIDGGSNLCRKIIWGQV